MIPHVRSGGEKSCILLAVHELTVIAKRDEYCKVLEQHFQDWSYILTICTVIDRCLYDISNMLELHQGHKYH